MSVDRGNVAPVTLSVDVGGPMDFDQLTECELLAAIRLESERIAAAEAHVRSGYARRLAMFDHGRGRRPPVKHRLLAEAAGVSDAAVINSLRRAAELTHNVG